MMLTSIISPGVAGVVLLVVLAGGYLMNRIIQKKYGYTLEREKELEEAKEEADFVLEHLKGQELQMPVVYDPEHILEDEARTDGVTGEQFTQNAKVFCKAIEEAGYDAMIYSNMLWEAYELDLEKLSDYPVWYADYEELPQTPYRFSMWQYSSTGSVPGIDGNVDLDIQFVKR